MESGCPFDPCHLPGVHLLCICRSSSDVWSHSLGRRMIRTDAWCGSVWTSIYDLTSSQVVLIRTGLQIQREKFWVSKHQKEGNLVHVFLVFSLEEFWKHESNRSDN